MKMIAAIVLLTSKERRKMGDVITTFKILN